RERQDGRGGEDGREAELTDRVTDGADRIVHADPLDGMDPPSVDPVPNARAASLHPPVSWTDRPGFPAGPRAIPVGSRGATSEPRFLKPTVYRGPFRPSGV